MTGPVKTNWPAPITQIPAFYRDNSITPLGPNVESSQFDDGTRRGLRIYCTAKAVGTVYDDDGASNGYRSHEFATTSVSAVKSHNTVTINIGGAVGSYTDEPTQRLWQVELYCRNAVSNVTADGVALSNLGNAAALVSAESGYYLDRTENLLYIKLPSAPITQTHRLTASLK